MNVTICGGGNAAHTLVAVLGQQGIEVDLFAPYPGEAERWRAGLARGGIRARTPSGSLVGQPRRISAEAAEVIPRASAVLLALPAFAHKSILQAIAPHLGEGTLVGALPARGGFHWAARQSIGPSPVIFGLQTLPWACRIRRYGEEVDILGTKAVVGLATDPADRAEALAETLSSWLNVTLRPEASMLALTLADVGQLLHPGIMYGLFHTWDGQPMGEDQVPLFYHGVDAETADLLQAMSDEVRAVRTALEPRLPACDFSAVVSLHEWLRRSYGDHIADPSTLHSSLVTNRAYEGLLAPVRPREENAHDQIMGVVPDFGSRYLVEDVPYGLVVTRGIAELAGVETPAIDQVIVWAQAVMGVEYLRDGRLTGRDVGSTRAPQVYGLSLSRLVA